MTTKYYLAIDIGASSGRHIVGFMQNGRLESREIYRFKNGVTLREGHLVWDLEALMDNVFEGLRIAFSEYGELESVAIDTWGVDYVLMCGAKPVLPAYAYRDSRTDSAISQVHELISPSLLYSKTGIQFQPFNSIYQLYADKLSGRLEGVTDFLMIPEYISYRLTGVKAHEYTNASTTGLLNVESGDYDADILQALGLPTRLFTPPLPAGSFLGELTDEASRRTGGQTRVLLCASHDTASAVEGIPIEGDNPFISSGTWSLLGTKLPHAITTEESRVANYSNEGGIGYTRYLKNIMGMWVINSLRAELTPTLSFDDIAKMARQSAFEGTVDLTDSRFLAPQSMSEAFASCFEEGKAPRSAADLFKCAHLSLAHGYKKALYELSALTSQKYERLYIVGGGAKNSYLNALTEELCGIRVVALPIEATAIGNLTVQIKASKQEQT